MTTTPFVSSTVIDYGPAVNDTVIIVTGDDDFHGPIDTPIGFACECEWTRQLHISVNGFVVLGSTWGSAPPRPPAMPVQPSDQAGSRPRVIAPFWTDLKFKTGISNVWYQTYYAYTSSTSAWNANLTMILKFKNESRELDTFEPLQAVVVTWENMVPVDVDATSTNELVTFQLVMLTDAVNTYAIFNYGRNSLDSRKRVSRPASMSWQCSQTYYSNTVSRSSAIYDEAFTKTNTIANSGVDSRGRWLFKLDYCPASYNNYRNKCYFWNHIETLSAFIPDMVVMLDIITPNCPCDRTRAASDMRFELVAVGMGLCYATTFPTVMDYGNRLCCYDESGVGSLLTTIPGAGFLGLHNPLRSTTQYQKQDLEPYKWCCIRSDLCTIFTSRRPVDDCTHYKAPTPGFMFGDPHIRTLDEAQFTFNGHGEYMLVQITNNIGDVVFVMQGRTEPINSGVTGELINATVFTAFTAEDKISGAYFHVEDNLAKDGFILFSNTWSEAMDNTLDFLQVITTIVHKDIIIRKNSNTSMDVIFSNGITIRVVITLELLDSSMTIPQHFRVNHTTAGLFGNNDDDSSNEFTFPNGTVLPANITERQIFAYGETWRIDSTTSRFQYRAGKQHSDFEYPDFTPLFIEDYNKTQIDGAKKMCGSVENFACLFDYLATLNEAIAAQTQIAADDAVVVSRVAKNSAPVVRFKQSKIEAKVSDTVTIEVKVEDTDRDNVTLHFNGPVAVTESGRNFTFTYQWTITDTQPVNISVYAEDGLSSSSKVRLPVSICSGCSENGQCVYTNVIALCNCNVGWEGTDCEHDIDECTVDPCAGNGMCTDLTPQAQQLSLNHVGFECQCVAGYTRVGGKCIDVDECTVDSPCDQQCTNTDGSYVCTCDTGYSRATDGCEDDNECSFGTSDCQHICTNTPGHYNCSCRSNYTLETDGKSCRIEETVKQLCAEKGCTHCTGSLVAGVNCFCTSGYQLAEDGKTCEDVDECGMSSCSQECTNNIGSFLCSCYDGYRLSVDKHSCIPCKDGAWGPSCQNICKCAHAVNCDKSLGCECQAGWTGGNCDVNIDECSAGLSLCSILQDCMDTQGSYHCDCKTGYQTTANNSCENIDECSPGGDNNCDPATAVCTDLSPLFTCQCAGGYIGDGYNCLDIDECEVKHECEQFCINVHGSYNCKCHVGYLLRDDRRTCEKSSDPCAGSHNNVTYDSCLSSGAHGCFNMSNDGVCFCRHGFQLTPSSSCEAINECEANSGRGNCSDICTDMVVGFSCYCTEGRQLIGDGLNCQACNTTDRWGTNCANRCDCGPGSSYCDSLTGCQCQAGWTGSSCGLNINECETGNTEICTGNQLCTDTPGSYICTCKTGYQLNVQQCIDIDECTGQNECNQRCVNTPGSYTCACHAGFEIASGSTSHCININECEHTSDNCEQACSDNAGSFTCLCREGFTLSSDQRTCIKDIDPCAAFSTTCEYGCQMQNNTAVCFCATDYKLDPSDSSSCLALHNKLWLRVTFDVEYLPSYGSHGSTEYKDMKSDLREAFILFYQSANLTHFSDVRIDNFSPGLLVEHVVVFDVQNISVSEELELAAILKHSRETNGVVRVGQTNTTITRESTIATLVNGTLYFVTCILCSPAECTLVSERDDLYSCVTVPDVNTSVEIEVEIRKQFSVSLTNKQTPAYSRLSQSVGSSLSDLFSSLSGFSGIGPIEFREGNVSSHGSIVIHTSVLYNMTAGSTQISEVARRLVDLDSNNCLHVDDSCVELVHQTALGPRGSIKAVCKTCTSSEDCLQNELTHDYTCVPSEPSPTQTENTNMILGLGIGIPMFFLFLFLVTLIIVVCMRRRREREDESVSSDPYRVRQAFGSVSSVFTGRQSDISETGGLFSRQYRQHWNKSQDIDEPAAVINYYRDPDRRDPYSQIHPSRSHLQPSAPVHEPQVASDFSWDFLYNALQPNSRFRIMRPTVENRPADVFRESRPDSHA